MPDEVLRALLSGDLERLKAVVRRDPACVNRDRNEHGATALMIAAARGLPFVRFLVEEGRADVNLQSNDGFTALLWAVGFCTENAQEGLAVVKYLVEQGHADLNLQDDDGITALMLAASHNLLPAVQYLTGAHADVTLQDNEGRTVFDYAQGESRRWLHENRARLEAASRAPAAAPQPEAGQLSPQQLHELLEEQHQIAQAELQAVRAETQAQVQAARAETQAARNDVQRAVETLRGSLLGLHRARLRDRQASFETVAARPGEEWQPGRDFDLGVRLNPAEGVNSVVFRIFRHGRLYALKALLHFNNQPDRSQSHFLANQFGAEWEIIRSLPAHPCIVPIVHHYFSREPDMRQYVQGPMRPHLARRTAFVVTPLYECSLASFLQAQKEAHLQAPFGLPWRWFSLLLIQLLEAVRHLCANNVVHGDIKPDQVLLTPDRQAVLADFGTAWRTVSQQGYELFFQSEEDLDRRAGVGTYKAPELRGRVQPPRQGQAPILLRQLYAKAESWTIGRVMFELLQQPGRERDNDVFMRLANSTMQQLREGQPQPQPGWEYEEADLPALPPGTPAALRESIIGLTLSSCEERWSAERALRHLQASLWGRPEAGGDVAAWTRQHQLEVLQAAAADEAMPVWETEMALRYLREL